MAAARTPYLLGHTEIAALYDVKRQTSQLWRTEGTLPEPDLLASGNPYWLLATVLRLDGHSGRAATSARLRAYRESQPDGYEVDEKSHLPVILGIKEVAVVCHVDEQTISRWRNRKTIAEPDLSLSGSPLWLLETVLNDAARRGRDVRAEDVERVRAGGRAPQKPRGRKTALPSSPPNKPLPLSRTFQPGEEAEAVRFVSHALSEGLSVVIRPKP
ncbi:hypothetical protein [Streptomyces sp. NPDC005345]|uniref:hypothetical protein n=1 Tax=Streptomyces sp. NPDC005345 TaxID=3156877 RepID=UPI0033AFF856